jgi:parallel beta-helix repeat protein
MVPGSARNWIAVNPLQQFSLNKNMTTLRKPIQNIIYTFLLALGAWGFLAAALPAQGATLIVDDNMACPGAAFTTISAAVAVASPGDTIQVCAGIYPETVNVDKQLTFEGAKANVDARSNRNTLALESIVASSGGAFVVGSVNDVTINGFTLRGANNEGAAAIGAFSGGSGITVINNVIRDNQNGMRESNPDGTHPANIRHNAFLNNSLGSTGNGGTGIFITSGPANNTYIQENKFTLHRETAINFAGDPSNPSANLVVIDNTSSNDSTFVVATDSTNALVDGNTIKYSGSTNGSGILDFGSNTNLRIAYNTISGGNNVGTSGIRVRNLSVTPSTGTTIVNNHVSGRYNGIRMTDTDGMYIASNTVSTSSNDGILGESGSNNILSRNHVSLSSIHDCEDDTTGSLTAGTANTWDDDSGTSNNSIPLGICGP